MKSNVMIQGRHVDKKTFKPTFKGANLTDAGYEQLLIDKETGRLLVQAGDDRESVNIKQVTPALTLFNSTQYTAGDVMGGKLFADKLIGRAGEALLESVRVLDMDDQGADMDLIFLSDDPSASVLTDNSPPTWAALDKPKITGYIRIVAADYISVGGGIKVAQKVFPLPIYSARADGGVYIVIIARGTPTYTNDPTKNVLIDVFVKQS